MRVCSWSVLWGLLSEKVYFVFTFQWPKMIFPTSILKILRCFPDYMVHDEKCAPTMMLALCREHDSPLWLWECQHHWFVAISYDVCCVVSYGPSAWALLIFLDTMVPGFLQIWSPFVDYFFRDFLFHPQSLTFHPWSLYTFTLSGWHEGVLQALRLH